MIFSIIKTYLYDLWDSFVIYTLIKFIFGKNDFLSDKNCISQKYKKNC